MNILIILILLIQATRYLSIALPWSNYPIGSTLKGLIFSNQPCYVFDWTFSSLTFKVINERYIVQLITCDWHFVTPWPAARQASPSFTISWSLLKLMSIKSVITSNHLILCRPLLLLPSIFANTRVFSSELALCIRWPKYWSFSISPSNEYSEFISFRIDWFDRLAVQGTLQESSPTPQFKSINSSAFSFL